MQGSLSQGSRCCKLEGKIIYNCFRLPYIYSGSPAFYRIYLEFSEFIWLTKGRRWGHMRFLSQNAEAEEVFQSWFMTLSFTRFVRFPPVRSTMYTGRSWRDLGQHHRHETRRHAHREMDTESYSLIPCWFHYPAHVLSLEIPGAMA